MNVLQNRNNSQWNLLTPANALHLGSVVCFRLLSRSTTKSAAESTRAFNEHAQRQGCQPITVACGKVPDPNGEEEETLVRRIAWAGFSVSHQNLAA
eukprot:scaffold53080_cov36-Cyclotella_meneghiniana.AAC.3